MPSISPFSDAELATLENTHFFALKASATARIRSSFEALRDALRPHLPQQGWLCEAMVDTQGGFITSGEDYLDLPYVVMDFPKHYSRREKLAMRTLFWWGHYVVYSLILEGPWLPEAAARIQRAVGELEAAHVEVSLATTPWDWRRGEGFTQPIRVDGLTGRWLSERTSIKLMRFLPLDRESFTPDGIVAAGRTSWDLFAPIACG